MLHILEKVLRSQEFIYRTKHIPYTKFWIYDRIMRPILKEPILDLGCAKGETFWYMKISGDIIGIDLFRPYLDIAKERKVYKKLILGDILKVEEYGLDLDRIKVCSALHVLEHLSIENAKRLLEKIEQIGETQIIATPYGFRQQDPFGGNDLEEHVSAFLPEFFEERGYKTYSYYQLTMKKGIHIFERAILAVRSSPQ